MSSAIIYVDITCIVTRFACLIILTSFKLAVSTRYRNVTFPPFLTQTSYTTGCNLKSAVYPVSTEYICCVHKRLPCVSNLFLGCPPVLGYTERFRTQWKVKSPFYRG